MRIKSFTISERLVLVPIEFLGAVKIGIIVLVAMVSMAFWFGFRTMFSVFLVALVDEFGWGRGETAGVQSLAMIVYIAAAPIAGGLVDRFGPRRVIVPGIVIEPMPMWWYFSAGGAARTISVPTFSFSASLRRIRSLSLSPGNAFSSLTSIQCPCTEECQSKQPKKAGCRFCGEPMSAAAARVAGVRGPGRARGPARIAASSWTSSQAR